MSKVVQLSRYGGPEVLEEGEAPTPEPGPGQIRIRVHAAAVNPMDLKVRSGMMATFMPVQFPAVLGLEAAGVVEAVGDGAPHAVGDAVFGPTVDGAYREQALLGVAARKPDEVPWELAASLPTMGTAYRVLRELGVTEGQTLLIHGAGGAVGSVTTQLAIRRGIRVVGTASEADLERVRGYGAFATVYGPGVVERVRELVPDGVDAVLDASGAGVLEDSIELAGGPERVITIADMGAAALGVRFSGGGGAPSGVEVYEELADLAASGDLDLPIWKTLPLAEAAQAHTDLEAHRNNGKIVLIP